MKIETVSEELNWDIYLSTNTSRFSNYWCGAINQESPQAAVCHVQLNERLGWLAIVSFLLFTLTIMYIVWWRRRFLTHFRHQD
jgi:hypothetical protein